MESDEDDDKYEPKEARSQIVYKMSIEDSGEEMNDFQK